MRYEDCISGPLLDRIDIHAAVPWVDYEKLSSDRMSELSAKTRERVEQAREREHSRFLGADQQDTDPYADISGTLPLSTTV